jgi:hypothetical protein
MISLAIIFFIAVLHAPPEWIVVALGKNIDNNVLVVVCPIRAGDCVTCRANQNQITDRLRNRINSSRKGTVVHVLSVVSCSRQRDGLRFAKDAQIESPYVIDEDNRRLQSIDSEDVLNRGVVVFWHDRMYKIVSVAQADRLLLTFR